jgi:hypothetical protein
MPLPLMARKHGGRLVLDEVVARLRCAVCGRKPPIVALVERTEPARTQSPEGLVYRVARRAFAGSMTRRGRSSGPKHSEKQAA